MHVTPPPGGERGPRPATPSDSALAATARQRLVALSTHAQYLYEAGQDLAGAEAYRRAAELAESISERDWNIRARFFQGAALHCAGRLHEAMAVLAPVVTLQDGLMTDDWVYMALTRYILIAVDLPVSVTRIDAAIEEAETHYPRVGGCGRRSRILIVRARLALARGRGREALALAQEALERRRREGLAFSYTTYMRTLVEICIELGDLDLARAYLSEWEQVHPQYPKSKEIMVAAAHSTLLRQERRYDEALGWARRAADAATQTDDFAARFTALRVYVRALICTSECDRAREPLAELLRLRHCAVGEVRFEVRLLRGDYHLAMARRQLQLPVVDSEFGLESDTTWVAPARLRSVRHFRLARQAYRCARQTADSIDALLDCDVRRRKVSTRSAFAER